MWQTRQGVTHHQLNIEHSSTGNIALGAWRIYGFWNGDSIRKRDKSDQRHTEERLEWQNMRSESGTCRSGYWSAFEWHVVLIKENMWDRCLNNKWNAYEKWSMYKQLWKAVHPIYHCLPVDIMLCVSPCHKLFIISAWLDKVHTINVSTSLLSSVTKSWWPLECIKSGVMSVFSFWA